MTHLKKLVGFPVKAISEYQYNDSVLLSNMTQMRVRMSFTHLFTHLSTPSKTLFFKR